MPRVFLFVENHLKTSEDCVDFGEAASQFLTFYDFLKGIVVRPEKMRHYIDPRVGQQSK